tara:strand:- start:1518 stop:2057 length:540 start_codon:yes stop_codon:yes gene_type:complete
MKDNQMAVLRKLLRNTLGIAAVEFAMVLPVLMLMYLGSYQLSQAIAAKRKVTITARVLTDLTTQSTSLTANDADTILTASQQVMAPYPSANGTFRISEIKVNANGSGTVQWSRSLRGTARTTYTIIPLPTGVGSTGTYVIMGEVSYRYVPAIVNNIVGSVNMSDTIYMAPRKSQDIPLT